MATGVENWDDDADFDADFNGAALFTQSVSTVQTSLSSRLSVNSESNIIDEDWQVQLTPDDDISTSNAIQSAKQAGVPIPSNVPASALVGGTIKRLGKKNSRQRLDDDWNGDLDFSAGGGLTLKPKKRIITPLALAEESEDWGEDLDLPGSGQLTIKPQKKRANTPSTLPEDSEDWGQDMDLPGSGHLTIKPHRKRVITPSALAEESDDWGQDLDLPGAGQLTLKPQKKEATPLSAFSEEKDDFDDWTEGEGSLGIRFAGSRRETRNRSSSASAMSPSLGSVTAESEEDDLRGLELPEGPVDLQALLKKRQATEAAQLPELESKIEQPKARTNVKSPLLTEDNDDFFNDLDVGAGDVFDTKKLKTNKNVVQKKAKPSAPGPARAPITTLTFAEKPAATRIPRPVSGKQPPSRLEPVLESGAAQVTRSRPQLTTTGTQLLRSKRSMPVLRGNYSAGPKPSIPFLPAGSSITQSHHMGPKPPAYHLRRDSDPTRAQSPPPRSFSRLSNAYVPDTPSRTSRRPEYAPRDLAREAATKKTLTRPQKKRFFGDGTELEVFDDLPTSVTKEAKFMKQPSARGAPKSLRNIPSRLELREQGVNSKLPLPDRMATPLPGPMTPRSPMKVFQEPSNTPRYLRDTAASRIARESRLGGGTNPRPRSDGPLMPVSTNWKAQVAARSPHTSPSAPRNKGRRVQPSLIKPTDAPVTGSEKGMTFNPLTHRWEGNENSLGVFDFPPPLSTPTPLSHTSPQLQQTSYLSHHNQHQPPPPASPPRPALIAPMSTAGTKNIQVVGGMVFDPVRMCWLKFKPDHAHQKSNPKSPSVTDNEDDDDPFAGIDDLKDGAANSTTGKAGGEGGKGGITGDVVGQVLEEFDLGPDFIRRQKEEEIAWRRKCEAWFGGASEEGPRLDGDVWRWNIREIAGLSPM